jgi:hypothetical protein
LDNNGVVARAFSQRSDLVLVDISRCGIAGLIPGKKNKVACRWLAMTA